MGTGFFVDDEPSAVLGRLLVGETVMNDEASNVAWLLNRIEKAGTHAEAISDDIWDQDALRLTGTVMRLDRVRNALEDAWRTLQLVYDEALDRDRTFNAHRAVSDTPASSSGVVADVLRAAATGVRAAGSPVDFGRDRTENVA